MKNIIKEKILSFQKKDLSLVKQRKLILPENSKKILSIIGPRRSGKSFFLYSHIQKLYQKGISPEQILFINFEDERLSLSGEDLGIILEAYQELYPERKISDIFLFFDEIQNVPRWEVFIRRIYDEGITNIFLTGSNAKLLSLEISTSLRGRSLSYEILPLDFEEYLSFSFPKREFSPHSIYSSEDRAFLLNAFDDYLYWGGFPEIVEREEELKLRILQEYFEVMMFTDIVERYSVPDVSLLKEFLKRLLQTTTKEFSVYKMGNDLRSMGYSFDKNILYRFLEYAENIFFGMVIKKFDFSLKKQHLLKKFYSIDNGFLQALSFRFSRDLGKLLENLVFLYLYRKYGKNIFFIKNGSDIDFLVNPEDPVLFQVCYELNEENRDREIGSLGKIMKKFSVKNGYVITRDQKFSEGDIEGIPFYELYL